jgi:hypothetical protein
MGEPLPGTDESTAERELRVRLEGGYEIVEQTIAALKEVRALAERQTSVGVASPLRRALSAEAEKAEAGLRRLLSIPLAASLAAQLDVERGAVERALANYGSLTEALPRLEREEHHVLVLRSASEHLARARQALEANDPEAAAREHAGAVGEEARAIEDALASQANTPELREWLGTFTREGQALEALVAAKLAVLGWKRQPNEPLAAGVARLAAEGPVAFVDWEPKNARTFAIVTGLMTVLPTSIVLLSGGLGTSAGVMAAAVAAIVGLSVSRLARGRHITRCGLTRQTLFLGDREFPVASLRGVHATRNVKRLTWLVRLELESRSETLRLVWLPPGLWNALAKAGVKVTPETLPPIPFP